MLSEAMTASGCLRSGRRVAVLLLLVLAAEASARGWEPTWSTTLEAVPGRSFLRGACVREGILYVTAVVTTPEVTDATPILYSLPVGESSPTAKRLWQGKAVIGPENGLSNPVCGADGVAFVVREAAKGTTDLVRVSEGGRESRRKLANVPLLQLAALRSLESGEWLLAATPPARLFVMKADGATRELPLEGLAEDESALDACAPGGGKVVLLTAAQFDQPVGVLKLRKWDAELKFDGAREIRASFGGLVCSPAAEEIQVLHLQPQGGGAGSFVLARFGPGLSGPQTKVVEAAAITSLSANGVWTDGAVDWAVTNYKMPSVYEVPRGADARLAWRDEDQRFGATTTPPSIAALDEGSVAVVYEAYDRSVKGLPVVLRAVRLKK
jgi:hypothetical protein